MADRLSIAQKVEEIVSQLVQRDVQLNKRQCELLHTRFKDTLNEVKEGTTAFSGSHQSMVILEEILVVARRVECIVRDCCYPDYVIAAIKAIDSKDMFIKLFADLDFCCVLTKSMNMECGMSRHKIRNYDWEENMNLVRAKPEVCNAANEDKEEIIRVVKELVEEKGDHRKVCQSLLNRLVDNLHTPRVEQSQHPPDFKEKETLDNQGAQATVFHAKWKEHCFVMKEFVIQRNQDPDKTFENEVKVLERLCHPNILNMVCHYTQPIPAHKDTERGIIVTEKMSKDLQKFLQDMETSAQGIDHLCLPPLETVDIMLQIAEGLNYLHNITPKAVAHRDVKPRNILIKSNPLVVKVGDFGLAKVKSSLSNSDQTLNKGTTKFLAPELFPEVLTASNSRIGARTETINRKWWKVRSKSTRDPMNVATDQVKFKVSADNLKGDVYSFGITCSVILCGHEPYNDISYGEVRSAVVGGRRPELPSATPLKLRRLLEKCWHKDPKERPSFLQIGKELRRFKAKLLIDRLQDCPPESDEDYVRRTLRSVCQLQTGPSRILVIGESEQDKKDLIDHVCGGLDNNSGNNNVQEERKSSVLPMWMYKGRDQVDMIKQVQVALDNVRTRNKIWTVNSIYNLWTLSYKPSLHAERNHNPLRDCRIRFHMMWLVYHVGRTCPKFEWKLVAPRKQKYLLPVQLLIIEDAEEDPRGNKFVSEFLSRKEYLFPGASEQEFKERILKVNVVAEEDIRIRLWVTCNVVQIRAEMQFATGIMSRIGKKLGLTGIKQIKSFAEHFTKEQVVCKSASFAFEVFCSLFEVPIDFREALEKRVKFWRPNIGISVSEDGTPPDGFMHYCVWVVGVIVYSKSLRPGGWSSFECTPGQYSWEAEIDECLDSHLLDLHTLEWKDLVDKKKTYEFLTKIFEDTRMRGAKHRNSTLPIALANPLSHDQRELEIDTSVSSTNSSRQVHGAVGPPDILLISDSEAPAPLWFSFRRLCPTIVFPLLKILRLHRP